MQEIAARLNIFGQRMILPPTSGRHTLLILMKGFLTLLLLFWACLAGTTLTATGAAPSLNTLVFNKTLNPGTGKSTPRPANRLKRIVIDAGHGGHDSGCDHAPTLEKTVNLNVARMLASAISANYPGIEVILTRDDDTFLELKERSALANSQHADLFISLHSNYAENREASGTETWVYSKARGQRDRYSRLFAKYVEESFELSGRNSRGIQEKNFSVLANTRMPAVLVELGFLSNSKEQKYLLSDEGQLDLTNSLYEAFGTYYHKVTGREPAAAIVSVQPTTKPMLEVEVTQVAVPEQPEPWKEKEVKPSRSATASVSDKPNVPVSIGSSSTPKPSLTGRVKRPLIALPPPVGSEAPTIIAVQVAALSKPWVKVPKSLTDYEQRVAEIRDGSLYRYQIRHLSSVAEARKIMTQLKSKGQESMLVVYRGKTRLTGTAMTVALNSLAEAERQRLAK